MNLPTRPLNEVTRALADREACRQSPTLEALAAAALPDLSPEDRETLEETHLDYFALKLMMGLSGSDALLQSFYVGVELGREMERWAMSREAR